MCVPVKVYVHHMHGRVHGGLQRVLGFLGLEVQAVVNTIWLLGIEPLLSASCVSSQPLSHPSSSQLSALKQVSTKTMSFESYLVMKHPK